MKDVKSEIFQNAWVFKIHFSFWCFANFSFISFFVVSIYVSASMFSKLKNTDNWKFYFRKSVHPTNFWDWTRKQGGCPISGTTFHFLGWRKYRFSESFLTVINGFGVFLLFFFIQWRQIFLTSRFTHTLFLIYSIHQHIILTSRMYVSPVLCDRGYIFQM